MKKLLPILLIVIVAGLVIWKLKAGRSSGQGDTVPGSAASSAEQALSKDAQNIVPPQAGDSGMMSSAADGGEEGDE